MSDDRLAELRRQRALAAEEQARLEREIAAAEAAPGALGVPSSPAPIPPKGESVAGSSIPDASPAQPIEAATEIEREALKILDSHRLSPKTVKKGVFRGCLIYLVLAFVLTGIGSVLLYFLFKLR